MFEKYTEQARQTIFFGRYEASQEGSTYIESAHLLLGLFRADKALLNRFLRSNATEESIRHQIQAQSLVRKPASGSPDLPLSQESKRVLAYAAEEAEGFSHKHIGTGHLLLGLLREEKCAAAVILAERGIRLSTTRAEVSRSENPKSAPQRSQEVDVLAKFSRDMTKDAVDGQLHPLVERNDELERVVQVLCRHTIKNPVVVGELDLVNRSLVEHLALRIAQDNVPAPLQAKRLVALEPAQLAMESSGPAQLRDRLRSLIKEITETQNVIIFFGELLELATNISADGWLDCARIMEAPLLAGKIQCVATTSPFGYSRFIGKHRTFLKCFEEVPVGRPDEGESVKVLVKLTERYEKFHGVTYGDDAVLAAIQLAKNDLSYGSSIREGASLLDDAGVRAQIRRCALLPREIRDVRMRIKFIVGRMERAIAEHQFEKARFYSDEERKERDNLRELQEKHPVDETTIVIVTREDIEEVARLRSATTVV